MKEKLKNDPKKKNENSKIYVAGNPLLDYDSIQFKIAEEVAKKLNMNLAYIQYPEDLMEALKTNGFLIDTVRGLKMIRIISLNEIINRKSRLRNSVTVHDHDIGFMIKLLNKLGYKLRIKIIGIPMEIPRNTNSKSIEKIISLIRN